MDPSTSTTRPLTPAAYRFTQRIGRQAGPLLRDALTDPHLPPWVREGLNAESTQFLGGIYLALREGDWPALLWRIEAPGTDGRTHIDVAATWIGPDIRTNWWDARSTDKSRLFALINT